MEIRCGNCNKLFRVSDDKITGKGIKFSCSRCGEYVKITKEDFENYTVSLTAATALDLFEQKAKSAAAPVSGAETVTAEKSVSAPATAIPQSDLVRPATVEPKPSDMPESSVPDFLQERHNPPVLELEPTVFDQQPVSTEAQHEQEPEPMQAKEEWLSEPEPKVKTDTVREPRQETKEEPKPEPQQSPAPITAMEPVSSQEPVPSAKPESKPALKLEPRSQPAPVLKPAPVAQPRTGPKLAVQPRTQPERKAAAGASAPVGSPATVKREAVRPSAPAPPMTVIGASPAAPARSGMLILLIVVILLALAGTGVFFYLRSSLKSAHEPISALTSMDGLHILSASGSMEPNGDLLISGEVENTTDKQKNAWYLVVDVFDANGSVINKLRLLNGKQLFTRNDYEIMTKRGMDVKDIKAKTLSEQVVVIPPKGKVPFEVRYLQPPIGVASFSAALHPFDPVRLYREIAEETK